MKQLTSPIFFKVLFLMLFLTFRIGCLLSQNYKGGPNYNDAQFFQNIYIEKVLTRKWNIHVNEEGRITENMTRPSYIYTDWGLTYKPQKYLHITLAYVPIAKRQPTDFVTYSHQFYLDFVFKFQFHHFILYDREMFQSQYGDINRSANWNIASYYLRNKVTVKFKPHKHKGFTPYVAEEIYYHDNNNQYNGKVMDRMRYFVGCFYHLNKLNEVELYYLIERHFNTPALSTNYIIGIGYAHDLY